MTEGYLLRPDSVQYELLQRTDERLHVLARWNTNGPEEMWGKPACDVHVRVNREPHRASQIFFELEDHVSVDKDLTQDFCRVYGLRGEFDTQSVEKRDIRTVGFVKVK